MPSLPLAMFQGLSKLDSPASWGAAPAPAVPTAVRASPNSHAAPVGPGLGPQPVTSWAAPTPVITPATAADNPPQLPDPMAPKPGGASIDASLALRDAEVQRANAISARAGAAPASTSLPVPQISRAELARMFGAGGGGGGGAPYNPATDIYSTSFDPLAGNTLTGPQKALFESQQELREQRGITADMVAQQQAEAIQQQAVAQQQAIEQAAAAEKQREAERKAWEADFGAQMQKFQSAQDEIARTKIDPNQFWGDTGPLGAIVFAAAAGLGEFAAAKTGQQNQVTAMIERMIDRNIQAQVATLESKQKSQGQQMNLLSQMRAKFGDEEQAYQATRAMMRENIANQLQAIATRNKGKEAAIVAGGMAEEQRLEADIERQSLGVQVADAIKARREAAARADAAAAAARQKELKEQNAAIFKSSLEVAQKDAEENGGQVNVTDAPLRLPNGTIVPASTPIVVGADGTPRLPQGKSGGAGLMVQPVEGVNELNEMVMGGPVRANSQKDAETYRGNAAKLASALANLNRLEAIHNKYPNGKLIDGNDAAEVETITDAIVQSFRTEGRSSDMDQRVMAAAYGANPLKKELYATVGLDEHSSKRKIDQLREMVQSELRRNSQMYLKGQPNGLKLGAPK